MATTDDENQEKGSN